MDQVFDFAVIGGGVVGCAMLRRLALAGCSTVLLERDADILSGASKGNSGILHTGFDSTPGTLEARLIQHGYSEYIRVAALLKLPLMATGAMVVAWDDEQYAKLDAIEAQARQNGVDDVRRLTRAEVLAREPRLASHAQGALLVQRESVIDPWSAPLAYAVHALARGATVLRNAEVVDGRYEGTYWTLSTAVGVVRARQVVNCAGLYGDIVQGRLGKAPSFEIRPRKGQFVVFDKATAELLDTIILAIPNERTKGIVLTRTAFGNLLVGPTAEEQKDRRRADVDSETLKDLVRQAVAILPALAGAHVTATYAGLRPATGTKDYHISVDRDAGLAVVGGIRSTGLSSALGIAHHVANLFGLAPEKDDQAPPRVPHLLDDEGRDWAQAGCGEIVCHCELVTRREVEAALSGPLPAGDFGGLKRRTRAGMGRCQGFYCNARLAALSAGKFQPSLAIEALHD